MAVASGERHPIGGVCPLAVTWMKDGMPAMPDSSSSLAPMETRFASTHLPARRTLLRPPAHRCAACGSTCYRRVIARDSSGAMRATSLYQCAGCTFQFADPKAWCADDRGRRAPAVAELESPRQG
jgi:hypothetical protein